MKLHHPTHLQGYSLQVKKWILLTLASLALIAFVYPSAFIFLKDTLPDNNDTRLIAYIIGQVQKNLIEHRPLHFGTFFAPDLNTLTYSDLFLTSAVLTLPFRLLTSSPIVIFNLALILGFALTIITSFLLFEYLFKDIWVTSLATILFNFSGFHLHYLPHLQVFSLWPLCLSLYFFIRFLNENRLLFLNLFFLTITLQLAESIFPAYLIFFTCLILLIATIKNADSAAEVPAKSRAERIRTRTRGTEVEHSFLRSSKRLHFLSQLFIHSLPFIPFWIFLLYPYYHLHTSFPEAIRPIRDAAHFSLGLDQIFTQFHSWTVIVLVITSLLSKAWQSIKVNTKLSGSPRRVLLAMTSWRGPKRIIFDPWKIILSFSLIMSLGPVLKIFGQNIRLLGFPIPLPYTLFYFLFPGFTGFRTPSRFIILALLAVCILIGFQIKPIFEKLKSKTKFIILLLVLSLLFWEADLPLKGYPVNINMHPVYQEVKNLPPEAVILELPIKLWNMPDHAIESIRSLYSLEHHHRRFGGFSGFATNSWVNLVEKINTSGLNFENTSQLKTLGVTHIIKENQLYSLQGLPAVEGESLKAECTYIGGCDSSTFTSR